MSENVFPPPMPPADAAPARVGSQDDDASTPDVLFGLSFDSVSRAQQFKLAIKGVAHDQIANPARAQRVLPAGVKVA